MERPRTLQRAPEGECTVPGAPPQPPFGWKPGNMEALALSKSAPQKGDFTVPGTLPPPFGGPQHGAPPTPPKAHPKGSLTLPGTPHRLRGDRQNGAPRTFQRRKEGVYRKPGTLPPPSGLWAGKWSASHSPTRTKGECFRPGALPPLRLDRQQERLAPLPKRTRRGSWDRNPGTPPPPSVDRGTWSASPLSKRPQKVSVPYPGLLPPALWLDRKNGAPPPLQRAPKRDFTVPGGPSHPLRPGRQKGAPRTLSQSANPKGVYRKPGALPPAFGWTGKNGAPRLSKSAPEGGVYRTPGTPPTALAGPPNMGRLSPKTKHSSFKPLLFTRRVKAKAPKHHPERRR
ncbi:unnamed protein product [Arctia plantaginis]|uniref:Uncharacterized protein n=1 Tax=Arctia plantaginis TaxID=874455 RepID=A0A8S1BWE2_ARCPL|nr:unnamed protein product [Arctia plantaginis]